MLNSSDIPILIVAFNRPALLIKRLNELSTQTLLPTKIFVSIDGPRLNNKEDQASQLQIVSALNSFKSPIIVEVLRKKENLGLSRNMLESIKHVLSRANQLIVIEDDVAIAPNFFENFTEAIKFYLTKDSTIYTIGGYSPLIMNKKIKLFETLLPSNKWRKTIYFHSWGWATTSIFWNQFIPIDKNTNFDIFFESSIIWKSFSKRKKDIWLKRFKREVWDYQVQANLFRLNRYNLFPHYSLIDNQGIGDLKSTNTRNKKPFYMLKNQFSERNLSLKKLSKTGLIWKFIEANTLAADGYFNSRARSKGIRTLLRNIKIK